MLTRQEAEALDKHYATLRGIEEMLATARAAGNDKAVRFLLAEFERHEARDPLAAAGSNPTGADSKSPSAATMAAPSPFCAHSQRPAAAALEASE